MIFSKEFLTDAEVEKKANESKATREKEYITKEGNQMKKGLTEMVFILDRSGSMGGLEKDTIGGYNELINKQRKVEGFAHVTTVLFDHDYEVLLDEIDIQNIPPLTEKEYYVRGSTALLDAIGKTIHRVRRRIKQTPMEEQPEKVIVVITTDGYENASLEYTYPDIKQLINRQKEQYHWEFLFLGANIAAEDVAEGIGIDRNKSVRFHADKQGMAVHYQSVNATIQNYRINGNIQADWKKEIDEDFKKRKK